MALVAACGPTGQDASDATGRLPQDLLDQIAQADGLVAEILADEWVTDAEVEQAFFSYVACIEEAGFEVTGNIDWSAASFGVAVHYGETTESEQAALAAMSWCYDEHFTLVHGVWGYQNRLSEQEVAERFRRIAECLRRNGVTVRFDTPESVFEATADGRAAILYGECYQSVVGG